MMKFIYLTFLLFFLSSRLVAQVSISNDNSPPDNSAMLDVMSTTKGFLAPRMTATERGNITSPATGLLVYQTDAMAGYYYYDGTNWVSINAGGFVHYIGEEYGGGIVVSVWKENGVEKGLIVSPEDLGTQGPWSTVKNIMIGSTAQSFFDGQSNTNAILGQSDTAHSAARICDEYYVTVNEITYDDWYLPAVWELNQCYNAVFIVNSILGSNNGLKAGDYWSSTEKDNSYAWSKSFTISWNVSVLKSSNLKVRAVRKF